MGMGCRSGSLHMHGLFESEEGEFPGGNFPTLITFAEKNFAIVCPVLDGLRRCTYVEGCLNVYTLIHYLYVGTLWKTPYPRTENLKDKK